MMVRLVELTKQLPPMKNMTRFSYHTTLIRHWEIRYLAQSLSYLPEAQSPNGLTKTFPTQ